uniref:RGS domain-containing protein n=1 Tax=Strongyloides stercoralis TaxID=6248 RepID=A0AAF5DP83_STRER
MDGIKKEIDKEKHHQVELIVKKENFVEIDNKDGDYNELHQSNKYIDVNEESKINISKLNEPYYSISVENITENERSKYGVSTFTRNGTHRLRDSRRCYAMRQKLFQDNLSNETIKKNSFKEVLNFQNHLQNISSHCSKNNFIKISSKSTLKRLSSSVSSLIEGKYIFTTTPSQNNKKSTKKNKNDNLSLVTNFSASPYHHSNMIRNSVKKTSNDENSIQFSGTKLFASYEGITNKSDEIINENSSFSLKDNTLIDDKIEGENDSNKGMKNISKCLGGAIKTSSLVDIQSIEENSIIQGISSETKLTIPNMWFKNFFFGRKKSNKKSNEQTSTEKLKFFSDEDNRSKKFSTDDQSHISNSYSFLLNKYDKNFCDKNKLNKEKLILFLFSLIFNYKKYTSCAYKFFFISIPFYEYKKTKKKYAIFHQVKINKSKPINTNKSIKLHILYRLKEASQSKSLPQCGTNKSNLLVKSLTGPINSTYPGEDNFQHQNNTLLFKEKNFFTSDSAFCDNFTVTNVPLHKLFIGSSSVCFQADLTASQESGNSEQQNQQKPKPSLKTEKDLSFLSIMPTLLTASKESDLEKILKCDTKRKPFQNFLEQQFCVENLNFYLAVEEYRKIPDEELTRRKAVGLQIFERHFITHSAEPVNIDNSTNRTIKDAVLAGKFTCDLYDVAQYQIFHLLKYDCWPRYLRVASAEDKDALGLEDSSDSYPKKFTESVKDSTDLQRSLRQKQEVDKFCTLLSNDGCSSEKICLKDPRESVAKWIANIAANYGMDKFSTEVVDAQTGSTIDPARQAVDALHNRCVRLVSVVFVTIEFLSPNATVKSSTPPQPARVVIVKARHSLTIGSAIRPLFAKYMIDPTQTAICFCGGVDQVPPRTQLGSIPPRKLTVMTYQQLQERQQMPKKDLQKLDINASPNLSQKDQNLPFHQHGDVAFYVQPIDNDGKSHKHSAIRSNSSNPRSEGSSESIMSRFRRKASQAVGNKDSDQNNCQNNSLKPSNKLSDTKSTVTHTRSGIATNNSQNKGAGGRKNSTPKIDNPSKKTVISSIDVPYCGENQKADEAFIIQKNELLKEEEEIKKKKENKEVEVSGLSGSQGTNGNLARVPAIYTSAVRSDKESVTTPSCPDTSSSLGWQPADYV